MDGFSAGSLLEAATDWLYQQAVAMLAQLFDILNEDGYNLFSQPWVKMLVELFKNLGWTLFAVGIVVAVFEFAIESQSGRGNLQATALNVLKGFFAVSLFTVAPMQLYGFAVGLQSLISDEMTDLLYITSGGEIGGVIGEVLATITANGIFRLILMLVMSYAVVKVFFSALKRGGILLIQIAVGSLYMFSVPRGLLEGFVMWIKQVIAICLTTFLQSAMLVCGLLVLNGNFLMGLGVMLAAGEIPRIAGAFGLETGTRANISSAVYTAQSAVSLTRTIKAVAAR